MDTAATWKVRFDRRRTLAWLSAAPLWAAHPAWAQLKTDENPEGSPRWKLVREQLYKGRAIEAASGDQLLLQVPKRASDPGFVPVVVRASAQTDAVQRLTLIIDNNPSPIAAVVEFPEGGAMPEFEMRVRVDEYSFMRAVAETRSGRLIAATQFVKASGGCAAAAGSDEAAAQASMGRMRFQSDQPAVDGQRMHVIWRISHPNHSGMAMNQLTRQFVPAHFVRQVRILQGDRVLLNADLDFAVSENPSIRFAFVPRGPADLSAEVDDSQGRQFAGRTPLAELVG